MSGAGPQARIPIVGMLLLSIVSIIFTGLVNASALTSSTGTVTGSNGNVTLSGGSSQCSGIGSCSGKVVGFFWDAISFNIAGAPEFIRFFFVSFYLATFILCLLVVLGLFTL